MKKGNLILFVLIIIMVFSSMFLESCNHIDLDYPAGTHQMKVRVEFDWADHPDASPSGMTVYFFRLDVPDGRVGKVPPIACDFRGRDGGSVLLAPGRYAAICHNNDSDRHGFVGYQSYQDFGLRLTNLQTGTGFNYGIPGLRNSDDERLANSPDDIWIASMDLVEIKQPATEDEFQTVRFIMQAVVHRYTFVIHNTVNYSKSMRIVASVSGMSGTLHPGQGLTGEETVTHVFEMMPVPTGELIGELLTFGHCGGKDIIPHKTKAVEVSHTLAVTAILEDGQIWKSVHDVTAQIHDSSTPDAVVVLDSLVIPKPVGGGWSPAVEDWSGKTELVGM